MSPVTLGTAIGAAAIAAGTGAISAVSSGLSFAAELTRSKGSSTGAAAAHVERPNPNPALDSEIEQLRQRVERCLAEAGIQLSQPVELVSNGQGGIAVAGAHPQQAAIEQALSGDLLLEHDFQRLASDCAERRSVTLASDGLPDWTLSIPATRRAI